MGRESGTDALLTPRLRLSGITRRFGETLANDRVDLAVRPGEIHALLGENGAGKSTLVKIIYGVLAPDAGLIEWDGVPVVIPDPNAARRLGIGMVFQHFSLFESLTVAENIALGLGGTERPADLAPRIAEVGARYGLAIAPRRHVHHLSVGERQRVEILRCLLRTPRLLIMDEPTSVLTPDEAESLFVVLRRLAAEGCGVLYISHKLDEIRAVCDAATVMRAGRVVGVCDPRRASARELAELMVGARVPSTHRGPTPTRGNSVLSVSGLSLAPDEPFGVHLRGVTLEVRAGEILGIGGVAGNGQAELLSVLSGERRTAPGAVMLAGRPVGRLGPAARRRLGLAFIPEERLGRGAVAELSLAENVLLTRDLSRLGLLRGARAIAFARRVIARFGVVSAGAEAPARSLSGGNLQKFIVGREIAPAGGRTLRLLMAAHPTWGVDVGAAAAIRQALIDLAAGGAAVLVVSEDLDELLEIADRIAVMAAGRLNAARAAREADMRMIGLEMAGVLC